LVGNIGKPVLEFLAEDNAEKLYVMEISSYQLEDFTGNPDMAVMLSFFPEHMDYHGGEEPYYQAKLNLARQIKEGGILIFNQGSEILKNHLEDLMPALEKKAVQIIPYNNDLNSRLIEVEGEWALEIDGDILFRESDLLIKGKHNLENLLAVAEVARQFQIDWKIFAKVAKEFQPLEHRLELVGKFKGIFFYNDAISTTPESTMAALDALHKNHIATLIVGGMDRGYHFEKLIEKMAEVKVENLILLPDTGKKIAKLIKTKNDYQPNLIECSNLEECVKKALEMTSAGQVCLLSCAAPSYNLFKNFEERGKLFKEAVRKLGQ
ncbi:UDP-N-acetylmuramoyl-L-alanine--D-glutamate ligase, partial [Candidatus Peregrinibacteria bacterium]|nr:UDP-N-acetylmuramoyl-L-alanine--D-glutamate ligase [Candidatus Peregrinibacteria bacterium]